MATFITSDKAIKGSLINLDNVVEIYKQAFTNQSGVVHTIEFMTTLDKLRRYEYRDVKDRDYEYDSLVQISSNLTKIKNL